MQKSSSMAKLAGVSYQDLASYITIISATTRQSGETIGQALKTIFARMEQVKAGANIDEEGEAINNVEKVLLKNGIALRDDANSFRNMSDVLQDVAAKYQELAESGDTVAQQQIIGAIAGVRQINMLSALFDNWDKVKVAQDAATNSAGLATDRYQIYLQGLEASANKFKVAWQGMWQTTVESGAIKAIYDIGAAFANAITKGGGLIPLFTKLIGLLLIIKGTTISAAIVASFASIGKAITSVIAAMKGLAVVSATNVVGALLLVVGVVYSLISSIPTLTERIEKATERMKELSDSIESLGDSRNNLATLWQEMEDLRQIEDKSVEQNKRLRDIYNEIKGIIPEVNGSYDAQGNFLIDVNAKLVTYIDLLEQEIAAKRELLRLEAEATVDDVLAAYDKEVDKLNALIEGQKAYNKLVKMYNEATPIQQAQMGAPSPMLKVDDKDIAKQRVVVESKVRAMVELYNTVGDASKETMRESLKGMEEFGQRVLDIIDGNVRYIDSWVENWQRVHGAIESGKKSLEELSAAAQTASETLATHQALLESVEETYYKTGQITYEQAQQLIAAGYAEALVIDTTTGKITIKAWMMRTLALAESDAAVATARAAYEQAYSVDKYNAATQAALARLNVQLALNQALSQGGGFTIPEMPAMPAVGGGGGGAPPTPASNEPSAEDLARERIDKEIKKLEEKKDALKDELDHFKEYIDAQKESLRLQKEEADFQDELKEKHKSLAKIKSQMAMLALDDSEEAKQRRLELQEEAAAQEQDIVQTNEDRKYDLQVEALDKLSDDFENAIQRQIDKLDDQIKKLEEQRDAIKDVETAVNDLASGYGGVGAVEDQTAESIMNNLMIEDDFLRNILAPGIQAIIDKWKGVQNGTIKAFEEAKAYAKWITEHPELAGMYNSGQLQMSQIPGTNGEYINGQWSWWHEGGLVEEHHEGNFAGNLESNEVFGKLLKGEYVSTESQMDNFMKNILPRIATYGVSNNSNASGDISLSMPITVQGNLDSSVVPDIKKIANNVITEINKAIISRGYVRTVNQTVS